MKGVLIFLCLLSITGYLLPGTAFAQEEENACMIPREEPDPPMCTQPINFQGGDQATLKELNINDMFNSPGQLFQIGARVIRDSIQKIGKGTFVYQLPNSQEDLRLGVLAKLSPPKLVKNFYDQITSILDDSALGKVNLRAWDSTASDLTSIVGTLPYTSKYIYGNRVSSYQLASYMSNPAVLKSLDVEIANPEDHDDLNLISQNFGETPTYASALDTEVGCFGSQKNLMTFQEEQGIKLTSAQLPMPNASSKTGKVLGSSDICTEGKEGNESKAQSCSTGVSTGGFNTYDAELSYFEGYSKEMPQVFNSFKNPMIETPPEDKKARIVLTVDGQTEEGRIHWDNLGTICQGYTYTQEALLTPKLSGQFTPTCLSSNPMPPISDDGEGDLPPGSFPAVFTEAANNPSINLPPMLPLAIALTEGLGSIDEDALGDSCMTYCYGAMQIAEGTWNGLVPRFIEIFGYTPTWNVLDDNVQMGALYLRVLVDYFYPYQTLVWNEEQVKTIAAAYNCGPGALTCISEGGWFLGLDSSTNVEYYYNDLTWAFYNQNCIPEVAACPF